MQVMTIVGARPQFIKAAPVSRALRQQHREFLVHTGQHYDPEMSDVFFEELNIPKPDLNLGIGASSNIEQLAHMMLKLQAAAAELRPDVILIFGDTNSTLAAALVGRAMNIPVAHVEAGLRSYNRLMPEENNRILSDHVSSLLFCPTQAAVDNLAKEGITQGVYLVGDVMIDALLENRARAGADRLAAFGVEVQNYYLATIHRPANTDQPEPLRAIFAALAALDQQAVLPVHPRLRKMREQFAIEAAPNIHLIPPVGYLDMLALSANARVILTDSGGLQKEAYALGVPCITMRDETEWIETIATGWNQLVGAHTEAILAAVQHAEAGLPSEHAMIYGDGHASQQIVQLLETVASNAKKTL